MSMAPPPPPTRHRSTASAPISGLPNTGGRTFGTPSRPAPAPARPVTPSNRSAAYPNATTSRPVHHANAHLDRPINSTPTHSSVSSSSLPSSSQATPVGQHTHALDPMSAASSVSAASAAVDSPQLRPTASRVVEPAHSRTASEHTRSGFSDPARPGSRIDSDLRLEQSAPSTPAKHRVTRSVGCPVSPSVEARRQGLESPSRAKLVEPNLPSAPSVWTPSELAQYLSWALRTGGADGQGPTLPSPVVEDVVSWVLRSQVTGRQFVIGVDQGVARPPPFLPVLAAMSRRLRRGTGSRLSDASTGTEASLEDDAKEQVTRVRRLAHAFENISSASEASADEAPSLSVLREQLTGESVHGFGRAAPRTEARNWSRRDSVASVASVASGISAGSHARWRPSDSGDSASASVWVTQLDEEAYARSNMSPTAPLRAKAEAKAALELAELADLTQKGADSDSPPPPYAPSPARAVLFPPTAPTTPEPRSASLTPLPASSPEPDSPSPSAHMARMGAHRAGGVDPYAVLRRSSRGTRPSAMLFTQPEDSDENKPVHWSTTRRATARPLRLSANVSPTAASPKAGTPGSLRRRRDAAMAREVAALTDRIRELEARLAAVETPAASLAGSVLHSDDRQDQRDKQDKQDGPKALRRRRRGLLAALGLADEHGNEPRLQDVPALLFLLGVGVGAGGCAIVVRILLQRKITA